MKNIHLIPTPKPSRIYLIKSNNKLGITSNNPEFTENFGSGTQNQNIYITSDEEIKDGDWGLSKLNEVILFGRRYNEKLYKKIILTTDQDLIKDGVQAIDDEFLEWFVKNPSCEEVEVEREKSIGYAGDRQRTFYGGYKIIIPKEEPKQVGIDWSGFPISTQEKVGYVEPKQETLEETKLNEKEFYKYMAKQDSWKSTGLIIQEFIQLKLKEQDKNKYSEADKIMKFLDTEVKLGLSDIKTIERIKWYFETYFEQFKNK
jgi:hypothetical protein